MSLQLVANHLAQKGRGPDSTLVHMSNREVAGLQALAKKHGGELTVNPDTGLPEAGFLDSLIPTIAGAGLTYFSGGAINPLMAAGIVGGISALDSKDLGKGLMAGLGAWGGGSMVGGLAGMGLETGAATATAPASEAAMAAIKDDAYKKAVGEGASKFGSMFASKPMDTIASFGGGSGLNAARTVFAAAAPAIMADQNVKTTTPAPDRGMIRPQTFVRQRIPQDYQEQQGNIGSRERRYFNDSYIAGDPYTAANGGLVALAAGGYAGRGEYRDNADAGLIGHYGRALRDYEKPSDGPGYFDPIRTGQKFFIDDGPNLRPPNRGYDQRDLFKRTAPLPANNMTGDSRNAYDYLMGNTNRVQLGGGPGVDGGTSGGTGTGTTPPPGTGGTTPPKGKGHYEFDPITKQYKWIPDPIKPADTTKTVVETTERGGGGGGREPEDPNSFSAQWAAMNDAEKEAYRLENPKTAMAQDAVGLLVSPLKFAYDKLQTFMGPDSSTGGPARYTPAAPDATPSEIAKQANPMSLDPAQRAASGEGVGSVPGAAHSGQGGYSGLGPGAGAGAASPSGPPSGSMSGSAPPSGVDSVQAGIAALAQAQERADVAAAQAAANARIAQAEAQAQARSQAEAAASARQAGERATAQAAAQARAEAASAAANVGNVQAPGEAGRGAAPSAPSMGAGAAPSGGGAPPSGGGGGNRSGESNSNPGDSGRGGGGAHAGGGGGGGGGGRVICTHFYRKGEMSHAMWRSDLEFTFKHLSPATIRGYQYWGIPYVKLMRKSKLAEDIMRPIALHRAKELSYQMGKIPKGSLFGKVVRLVLEPICFGIGLFVGEQNWQSLWKPAKD